MVALLPGAEETAVDVNEIERFRLPGLHPIQPHQDLLIEH